MGETLKKELEEAATQKTEATIYVEGISYDADESALVSHFSSCGIVKEVRLPRYDSTCSINALNWKIEMWCYYRYQDSGRPRGYGHVVFESQQAAKDALKLDGKYMMGR